MAAATATSTYIYHKRVDFFVSKMYEFCIFFSFQVTLLDMQSSISLQVGEEPIISHDYDIVVPPATRVPDYLIDAPLYFSLLQDVLPNDMVGIDCCLYLHANLLMLICECV